MSSDHQSESRSETPSGAVPTGASMAAEVRLRGEPLLDALEQHQRAEATGSYVASEAGWRSNRDRSADQPRGGGLRASLVPARA